MEAEEERVNGSRPWGTRMLVGHAKPTPTHSGGHQGLVRAMRKGFSPVFRASHEGLGPRQIERYRKSGGVHEEKELFPWASD